MEYWWKYRDDLYKQVVMKSDNGPPPKVPNPLKSEQSRADERFRQSLQRARNKVEQYALCNDWEYFGTFTLADNRGDLERFNARFRSLCKNTRRNLDADVSYVCVPELHSDGLNWHMHGLLNLPSMCLEEYDGSDIHLPLYIRQRLQAGKRLFRWVKYESLFGWCILEPVRDRDKAARYITKYIGKGMADTAKKVGRNKHLYYASRGLQKAIKVSPSDMRTSDGEGKPGNLVKNFERTYEHCVIRWFGTPLIALHDLPSEQT